MKNTNNLEINSWTTKVNVDSNSPFEVKNKYEKIINEFSNVDKGNSVHEYKKNIIKTLNPLYQVLTDLNETVFEDEESKNLAKKYRKKILMLLYKRIKYLDQVITIDKSYLDNLNKKVILKVDQVSKFYSSKKMTIRILNNISFEIENGDFAVILGPSGSGKTTLMNLISGMDRPTCGKVWVNGFHLEEMNEKNLTVFRKNNIGYIFQRYGLLPNLTVYENVLMGSYLGKNENKFSDNSIYKKTSYSKEELKKINEKEKELSNISRKDEEKKINDILKNFGLENFRNKYPYELSGGQKQRVSISRTVAKNPKIIFGDEPTGAVDSEMSGLIVESFAKINNELKTTIVIITHDESIAKFANKVIYIADGKLSKIVHKQKGKDTNLVK